MDDGSKDSTTTALVFVPIVLVILILCAVFYAALSSRFRGFKARVVGPFIKQEQFPHLNQPQSGALPREPRVIRLSDDSCGVERDQEAVLKV